MCNDRTLKYKTEENALLGENRETAPGDPSGAMPPSSSSDAPVPRGTGSSKSAGAGCALALVGAGAWGRELGRSFLRMPLVNFKYVVDVDAQARSEAGAELGSGTPTPPVLTDDFRMALADAAVAAVVIATPDHSSAPIAIEACRAGKYVYIAGAPGRTIREGSALLAEAAEHGSGVQVALAHRGAHFANLAREAVEGGLLGAVSHVTVFYPPPVVDTYADAGDDDPGHEHDPDRGGRPGDGAYDGAGRAWARAPRGLSWDRWLGPAPSVPYSPSRHRAWPSFWAYGGGPLMARGLELVDLGRFVMGDPPAPRSVLCLGSGGSAERTPRSQAAICDFGTWTMIIQSGHGDGGDRIFDSTDSRGHEQPFWRTVPHVQVTGTKATMLVAPRGCGFVVFGKDGRWRKECRDHTPPSHHEECFIANIRAKTMPRSDVENAVASATVVHLANASYRRGGKQLVYDPLAGRVVNDQEADRLQDVEWRAPYGAPPAATSVNSARPAPGLVGAATRATSGTVSER